MITPMIANLKRVYAEGPSGQIHYYDAGGGGAPLILIHQSPTSAIDFAKVFPLLAHEGFRVLALDLPGMGMSDAPPWDPTIPDYAKAVVCVLDHAGIKTADAFGHHTGAEVALVAAQDFPGRLRRLALYGLACMTVEAKDALWRRIVPAEKTHGLFTPDPEGNHLSALFQRLAPTYGLEAANRMVLSRMLAGERLWNGHNAALTWDIRPALAAVDNEIVFITHDGEMLDAATREARALRPACPLVVLEGRFATAMDSAPEALTAATAEFLKGP
jgi:pimeloyl-ACP methyl ester carboxylesterase